MRITNPNQIIDKETIIKGCNKLEEAFQDFINCAKIVNTAATTCTPKALSVDNTSMQPILEELSDNFITYEKSIRKITEAIKSAVQNQYNKEILEYEKYLEQQRIADKTNETITQ